MRLIRNKRQDWLTWIRDLSKFIWKRILLNVHRSVHVDSNTHGCIFPNCLEYSLKTMPHCFVCYLCGDSSNVRNGSNAFTVKGFAHNYVGMLTILLVIFYFLSFFLVHYDFHFQLTMISAPVQLLKFRPWLVLQIRYQFF